MKRIARTAVFVFVVLCIAGCRRAGPAPATPVRAQPPAVEVQVPASHGPPAGEARQPSAGPARPQRPQPEPAKTSEGRSLRAVGRAVKNALLGRSEAKR
jgi:hypothetical protein